MVSWARVCSVVGRVDSGDSRLPAPVTSDGCDSRAQVRRKEVPQVP